MKSWSRRKLFMKLRNTDGVAGIATFLITFVWVVFTGLFCYGFTKNPILAIFMAVFGSAIFEALHLWAMIKTKTFWNDKKVVIVTKTKWFSNKKYEKEKISYKRTPYLVLLVLAASFTIFSAVSWAGRVVSEYEAEAKDITYALTTSKNKIDELTKTINTLQIRADNLVGSEDEKQANKYNTVYARLTNEQANRDLAEQKYNDLKKSATEEELKKSESVSSFEFYRRATGLNTQIVVIIFMILFFGTLWLGYFLTCPEEDKPMLMLNEKDDIFKYIEALMDIEPDKKRLNNNEVISSKTKLSLSTCKRFENMLSGKDTENAITLRTPKGDKVPMITISQGKREANFSKDNMLKIINNKASLS